MKGFLIRDLHDNDYCGIVENNRDYLFSGRCQVRVFSLMDSFPLENLPWATPVNSTVFGSSGSGSLSVPKVGQIVRVQFNNGDIYAPEYTTIQNIDTQLIDQIKADYEGTHVLLYDASANLNLIYQPKSGFKLYFADSFLQITPDSMITIQHANSDSIIQLQGDKCNITTKNEINIAAGAKITQVADQLDINGKTATKLGPGPWNHAVMGEVLLALLTTFAGVLDAKMPPTPGVNVGLINSIKDSLLSQNVQISL